MPEPESEFTVEALKMLRAKAGSLEGAHRLPLGRGHITSKGGSSAVNASGLCEAREGHTRGQRGGTHG